MPHARLSARARLSRGRRPVLYLYRRRVARGGLAYMLNVLVPPGASTARYAAACRVAVAAAGVYLPTSLGTEPRAARRRLRALLRAWGWPGRDVRDACAWMGLERVACPSWPRRLRWAR
jgi:hypothetical protein